MQKGVQTLDDIRSRCRVDPDTSCWIWAGAYSRTARSPKYQTPVTYYPAEERTMSVYRLAVTLSRGAPPDRSVLCWPRCRHSGCCNPDHISAGKRAEMSVQLALNGRLSSPARSAANALSGRARSKLSAEDIAAMRSSGLGCGQLAKLHGICKSHAWRILTGRAWGPVRGSSVFALPP